MNYGTAINNDLTFSLLVAVDHREKEEKGNGWVAETNKW